MKILITGAAGFAGQYAVTHFALERGWTVHAAKLPSEHMPAALQALCTEHDLDLTDAAAVQALLHDTAPDCILHLAAQSSVAVSWKQPALTAQVNVTGTVNLLEAARTLNPMPRVLCIGSAEEYGVLKPEQCPVSEETPLHPVNIYAATKAAAEQLCGIYSRSCGLPVICVRAFNHAGAGQRTQFVLADFCMQAAEIAQGLREPVIRTGNCTVQRDFTDVRDIVRAYGLLLEHGKAGEVYNVGSGRAQPLSALLEQIKALSGTDFRIETDPQKFRPAETPLLCADIRKITADTGWVPEIPLHETLSAMLHAAQEEVRHA